MGALLLKALGQTAEILLPGGHGDSAFLYHSHEFFFHVGSGKGASRKIPLGVPLLTDGVN